MMTQTPISITGLVRNIGGLPQTNTPIRLRVYLETSASNNGALATAQWNGSAVVDRIVNATINSGDEVNVVYDLTWVPQSYQPLAGMGYGPCAPLRMANNISPRYRIEISVSSG
ncbi:MAG: hypothetical protein IPP80_00415 [Ignavibacteria bacterium]|nr:hypothetical protein [Ignavibacteria bacterium]